MVGLGGRVEKLATILGLGVGAGTIQEESYDFLEEVLADVHGAVDAVAGLRPVHFANGDLPRQSCSAVTELDAEQVPAQDHGYAVKGVSVPRGGLARGQALAADQNVSAMV